MKAFAARFGGATLAAQAGQIIWLAAGSRAMPRDRFGTILAAQALYGLLQIAVDNGSAWHGARIAAAGALDDDRRGEIFRIRLQFVVPSLVVAFGFGLAAGSTALAAIAPFMFALILFALLNYWEDFGEGNAAPWSAYIALRAFGPAVAAMICWLTPVGFPAPLAGVLECIAIIAVAAGFGLRPLRGLVLARRARSGPWREALTIGSTSVLSQGTLAYGTVLLTTTGHAANAALLAVGVRLLTGVNGIVGVVTTALFPRLAKRGATEGGKWSLQDRDRVSLVAWLVVVVAAGAAGLFMADPKFFTHLLLDDVTHSAASTSGIVLGCGAASGIALLLTAVHIAEGTERIPLRGVMISTGFTVIVTTGILAAPGFRLTGIALTLLAGQLLLMAVLGHATTRHAAEFTGVLRSVSIIAFAIAALVIVGMTYHDGQAPVALTLIVLAAATGVKAGQVRRRLYDSATT